MSELKFNLKHTPGPWEVNENEIISHGKVIASLSYYWCEDYYDYDNGLPNSKLISAAPEMLDALIDDYKFIEKFFSKYADILIPFDYNDFICRQTEIKYSIEKATGLKIEDIIS